MKRCKSDNEEIFTSYTEGKRKRGFSRPCFLCVQTTYDELTESQLAFTCLIPIRPIHTTH